MDQIGMENPFPPISIKSEYEAAIRPLTKSEYESLTNSIREKGLEEPIVINAEGVILDGHNRFRICQSLGIGIPPELFRIKKFSNILEEELYVNEVNLLRRQLTAVQRVQQVLKIKPIFEKLAKENMSKRGQGVQIRTPLERVNKQLADKADVRLTKFNQIEYLLNNASEEDRRKLLADRVKPNKLYGRYRNNAFLKKQLALSKQFLKSSNQITLWEGDFLEQYARIERDSVSLIHTDPPYDEEHLYLYDGLGKVAIEVLHPGGSLITYINQAQLFVIGNKLLNTGLKFWWPFYLKMAGNPSRIFDRHMEVDIKMLLWFVKGDRPINPSFPKTKNDGKRNYLGDLIISEVPDKRFHDFGQNPKDAEYFLKYLTAPNDLIVDPFVGGGSTAVACMNMKRKFIGIDIDPTAIERTKANLRVTLEISKEEKVSPTNACDMYLLS
jgi:hypothetical protein